MRPPTSGGGVRHSDGTEAPLDGLTAPLDVAPGGPGLLIVGPVLGRASWHAYRGAVAAVAAASPPR